MSNYGEQGVLVIFEIDPVEIERLKGAAWVSYVMPRTNNYPQIAQA